MRALALDKGIPRSASVAMKSRRELQNIADSECAYGEKERGRCHSFSANSHGAELLFLAICDVREALGPRAEAASIALMEAGQNVVEHAYRGSRLGPKLVHFSCHISHSCDELRLSIADDGVGIAESMRAQPEAAHGTANMACERALVRRAVIGSGRIGHRGQGFASMRRVVDGCPGARLIVHSSGHTCTYGEQPPGEDCASNEQARLGTQIELVLPVARNAARF